MTPSAHNISADKLYHFQITVENNCNYLITHQHVTCQNSSLSTPDQTFGSAPDGVAGGSPEENVFFYHTDPMGTPVAMSDHTGTKVWEADYLPFGREYTVEEATIANNRRFINKEKDAESGYSYFGARYLDINLGRFLTPDPVKLVDQSGKINQAILNAPQRLNMYVYGLNNPYRYIDPDGNEVRLVGTSAQQQYTLGQLKKFTQGKLSINNRGVVSRSSSNSDGAIEKDIDRLISSKNKYRIHATVDVETGFGRSHTAPSSSGGADIYFDPKVDATYTSGFLSRSSASPASELAHEILGRATQIEDGIPHGRQGSSTRRRSNNRAVKKANPAYKRMGMKKRTSYH